MRLLVDAVRQIARSRRHVVSAALCAALGLAAAGAVGALLEIVFLRLLPFPASDRLVRVWMAHPEAEPRIDLTIPELDAVVAHVRAFDAVAGSARVREIGLFAQGAVRMRGEAVTPDYFAVTGVRPALGRLFEPAEFDRPVTVLSHATWMSLFGGDPGVVGRSLRTTRGEYVIAGVLPEWFHGAIEEDEVEFWIPLPQLQPHEALASTRSRRVWVLARLGPDVTLEAALREE